MIRQGLSSHGKIEAVVPSDVDHSLGVFLEGLKRHVLESLKLAFGRGMCSL
jgi:hypothetical protein